MKCPQCDQTLERVTYEDVPVMQCPKCSGYFVAQNRLLLIKSSRDQNPAALQKEAQFESAPDTAEAIKCPKCLVDRMKKQQVRVDDENSFLLDVCPRCRHIWLDGGELARLQINHEQSAKAIDDFARQSSLEQMPEERRQQLDRDIENLDKGEGVIETFTVQWLLRGAVILLFAATFWSLWYYQAAMWSGVYSFVLTGLMVWISINRVDASSRQRLAFSIFAGLLETSYLVYLIFFY